MEKVRYLGLDLGTTTGYAYKDIDLETHTVLKSGIGQIKMGKLPMPERWQLFFSRVSELMEPATVICYEQVRHHAGVRAAHVYGAFLALMELAAHETVVQRPLRFVPVNPTQLKKFATGKGTASKLHMIDAAHKYFPEMARTVGIRSHDEADALWILQWGIQDGRPTHREADEASLGEPSPTGK